MGIFTGIFRSRDAPTMKSGRIPGAVKIGSYWAIPADAEKPTDLRIKSSKYVKKDIGLE